MFSDHIHWSKPEPVSILWHPFPECKHLNTGEEASETFLGDLPVLLLTLRSLRLPAQLISLPILEASSDGRTSLDREVNYITSGAQFWQLWVLPNLLTADVIHHWHNYHSVGIV